MKIPCVLAISVAAETWLDPLPEVNALCWVRLFSEAADSDLRCLRSVVWLLLDSGQIHLLALPVDHLPLPAILPLILSELADESYEANGWLFPPEIHITPLPQGPAVPCLLDAFGTQPLLPAMRELHYEIGGEDLWLLEWGEISCDITNPMHAIEEQITRHLSNLERSPVLIEAQSLFASRLNKVLLTVDGAQHCPSLLRYNRLQELSQGTRNRMQAMSLTPQLAIHHLVAQDQVADAIDSGQSLTEAIAKYYGITLSTARWLCRQNQLTPSHPYFMSILHILNGMPPEKRPAKGSMDISFVARWLKWYVCVVSASELPALLHPQYLRELGSTYFRAGFGSVAEQFEDADEERGVLWNLNPLYVFSEVCLGVWKENNPSIPNCADVLCGHRLKYFVAAAMQWSGVFSQSGLPIKWEALLGEVIHVDGTRFTELTSRAQLLQEGREMRHCVAHQETRYRFGHAFVFSMRSSVPRPERSTLELCLDLSNRLQISGHSCANNLAPSPNQVRQALSFQDYLNANYRQRAINLAGCEKNMAIAALRDIHARCPAHSLHI